MTLFKQNLSKNLILLIITLAIVSFFGLALISAAEAAYGLNPSFKQVKTADNPAVYYLDHQRGFKKVYVSEKAYLSYGNKISDIKIVSQEQLDKWPEMNLVKTRNSNQVYYLSHGQKALIESEQQFIDYGFNWADIVTISAADLNEYKLTDFDKVKASLNGGENADASNQSGLLKINSVSVNQTALYIPTGSRGNVMAAFRLEAAGANIKITNLTFSQRGVSPDDIIDSVYLVDESGTVYGYRYPLINKQLNINMAGQPIIIAAGDSEIFYLKADLKALGGVAGQTLKFGIISPIDITSNSQISAVLPLFGPEFRLADGVNNLGKIRATTLTLSAAGDKISLGATNKAVMSFRLAETSGNEDILIKQMTITDIGSTLDGDLRNLVLTDQSGYSVFKAQAMLDRKIIFSLEPGYLIRKNHYADFTLKTGVISGDGRDIKFAILSDSDITAVSKDNNYNLAVINDSAPAGNANRFTIVRAPVFLTAPALKAGERLVYRDQADAVLGSFELRNNTENIKLSSLTLSIIKSTGAAGLDQPLIAVDAKTGALLGSIDARKITDNFAEINLGNFLAEKGQTAKIKFKTHIPDTARSGDNYQISVKSVNYHIAENNIPYSDSAGLLGQKIEVVRPTIYLYSGRLEADDIAVAGDDQVYLGFFKIEATNEEDIRITSLTVTNAAGMTPINYANGFTNLALYKGGYRVSDIIAEPNANSYTFEDLSVYVAAGTAADLYVRADVAANAAGKVKLILENAAAEDYVSGIPGEVNNKNVASPEMAISQTTLEIRSLNGGSAARGQRTNQIASFTITNKSTEKVRLNTIVLNASGMAGNISNNNGFSNLRFGYTDSRGQAVSIGSSVKPVADVNEIGLNGFTYDPGETFTINLYVDAAADAAVGNISLFIRNIQAKGVISGVDAAINGLPTNAVEAIVN